MEVLHHLQALIALLVLGAALWAVPRGPVFRWRLRRGIYLSIDPDLPVAVRERAVADVRARVPLLGPLPAAAVPAPLPPGEDPAELRYRVTIPPAANGCPGVRLSLPWSSAPELPGVEHASRTIVRVRLGNGRWLQVVVLGRVGAVVDGRALPAARDRWAAADLLGGPSRPVGDVVTGQSAAGPIWRRTSKVGNVVVTDTQLDHSGWALVLGVVRGESDDSVDGLDDAVLATWEWLIPEEREAVREVGPTGAVTPPSNDGSSAPDGRLQVVDEDGAARASFRVPAAPAEVVAQGVPSPDGSLTCTYVRLTATSSLAVTLRPVVPGRDARTALERPARRRWSRRMTPTGPVRERRTPTGAVLSRTFAVAGYLRTEVRVDRDGLAWRWLLTYAPEETAVLAVLEDALQTWRWERAEPLAV